jgi:hypothetical protein
MARTREQWNSEINAWATTAGYSPSAVAEWKFLRDLVVSIAILIEGIFEMFKKDVEDTLAKKQPGTIFQYVDVAKEFQFGDNLTVINGKPQYVPVDISHRIITHASARESGTDNILFIKVAKTVANVLTALSGGELSAFQVYMEAKRAPGTYLNVSSQAPDLVKYTLTGSFDPLYTQANIQSGVDGALQAFRDTFRFDGVFYVSELIEILNAVPGFVLNTWVIEWFDTTNAVWVTFNNSQALDAGYFNWDGGSGISLTSL